MTTNKQKLWCFFGVHEYRAIGEGPYERTIEGVVVSTGCYFILRCQICGNVKRRILA